MGVINYSRGGWVMQYSRQKCWDEGPCALRGGVGGLRGGVGGLCGGPGEAGRGARRHRGRFSREARAHSPPSRPPLRWGIPGARGAGCLFPGRPERLAGHSWRARSGHCPRRGFSCHIPVGEDKEAVRRRRGGECSFAPASHAKRTVVERAFASHKQWRRAHWTPAMDELAIVHTTGPLIHTILTRPTKKTHPRRCPHHLGLRHAGNPRAYLGLSGATAR